MDISPRLRRRIERDFPEPGSAKGIADLVTNAVESLQLSHWESDHVERIAAAMVIGANGDLGRLRDMRELARQDWRDALVAADLANGNWPERLDTELGP